MTITAGNNPVLAAGDPLMEAAREHGGRFGDALTIFDLPAELRGKAAELLRAAVRDGRELTGDGFRAALGLDELPPGADT